jgi:hypothetical protein
MVRALVTGSRGAVSLCFTPLLSNALLDLLPPAFLYGVSINSVFASQNLMSQANLKCLALQSSEPFTIVAKLFNLFTRAT